MPIPLIVGMFLALSVAANRAYYGNKPVTVKAGEVLTIHNDGTWTIVKPHTLPAPVEPDVELPPYPSTDANTLTVPATDKAETNTEGI